MDDQIQIAFRPLYLPGQAHQVRVGVAGEAGQDAEAGTHTDRVMDRVAVIHAHGGSPAGQFFAQPCLSCQIDMVVVKGDPLALLVALVAARGWGMNGRR